MEEFRIRLNDLHPSREPVFVPQLEHLLLDLQRLIIRKRYNRWNSLKQWLINADIAFGVDGIVGQIKKLNYPRLLKCLIVEAISSKLFFHELARCELGKRCFSLLLLHEILL